MNKALRETKPRRVLLRDVRHLLQTYEDTVYGLIRSAAIARQFCPTNASIAKRMKVRENTVVTAVARLRRAKKFDIEIVQGRRVATFPDGVRTKLPLVTGHEPKRTTGKVRIPCLCCDKPFWSVDKKTNRMCQNCK